MLPYETQSNLAKKLESDSTIFPITTVKFLSVIFREERHGTCNCEMYLAAASSSTDCIAEMTNSISLSTPSMSRS